MQRYLYIFALLAITITAPAASGAVKDQSRLGDDTEQSTPPPANNYLPDSEFLDEPPETLPEDNDQPTGEFDINNIPAVETVELTLDSAKRALEAYAVVGEKYNDQGLDQYDTLEEFVKNTQAGKKLEAEVKSFGFANIVEWNSAIMAVSFAWSSILYDQDEDIKSQIDIVKEDKTIEAKEKRRIIASLNALLPSENNKKIVTQMSKDDELAKKLQLLSAFE